MAPAKCAGPTSVLTFLGFKLCIWRAGTAYQFCPSHEHTQMHQAHGAVELTGTLTGMGGSIAGVAHRSEGVTTNPVCPSGLGRQWVGR